MNKIENLTEISSREKFFLRVNNFFRVKVVAYSVSAAAAFGTGFLSQKYERGITGYDPSVHKKLTSEIENKNNEFSSFVKNKEKEQRKSLIDWGVDTLDKIKKGILNPQEFIQSTDTYKTILLKFYSALSFIDDAAFILPALLMFIMLGGYISRRLLEMGGDAATKEENRRIILKINEIIDASNKLVEEIDSKGYQSFNDEEIKQIKEMIISAGDSLPKSKEIEENKAV